MKSQPNRDYVSDDVIFTPDELAAAIVAHFKPTGLILEPCRGGGAFTRAMPGCGWCEITEGTDFFRNHSIGVYDWIVTNPPWSQIRPFLQHSMKLADNVVFLVTINHLWTKARLRDIRLAGFGIKEIAICDTPKNFPQSGFQLGCFHVQRGYEGPIIFSKI